MTLHDMFMARHAEIEGRLEHLSTLEYQDKSSPVPRPMDLTGPPGALLSAALDLPDSNFSSWMAGMPLAALLAAGRRVTVDVSPNFLQAFRRNYGISEDAFVAFAKAGLLLLNIRDFDPGDPNEDRRRNKASEYAPWERFLSRIMEEASNSVYFLAALRERIFDPIPDFRLARGVEKPGLRASFEKAERELKGAASAAKALTKRDSEAARAIFRTEEAAPVATFWHYAYVTSVAALVEPGFMSYLEKEYKALSKAPEDGYVKRDQGAAFKLGTRFVAFQMRMRFAHLLYSAPLSASFGGSYGYSLDDELIFLQAVDREFRWSEETPFELDYYDDDLLDLIKDLQVGRLRPRFQQHFKNRDWEMLSALGVEAFCRSEPTTYFDHYQDPTNQAELIDYWLEQSSRQLTYVELEAELDGLLGNPEGIRPKTLVELAALKEEARVVASGSLRKHTEGYQLISRPGRGSANYAGEVRSNNVKEVNALLQLLYNAGLQRFNGTTAIGGQRDYRRSGYSSGAAFRNPPA